MAWKSFLLVFLTKPKRHKMVFYKFGFLFIGVPKTGTTSIQRTLQNATDKYHDHYTYFEEYKRHDKEVLDSFYQFSVVRNPYDRFVSMAYQWARDAKKHEKDVNKICEMLRGMTQEQLDAKNEMFNPQWHYLWSEGEGVKIKNIWRFENISETYEAFAHIYNVHSRFKIPLTLKKENVSRARTLVWREELNDESIAIINDLYRRDFEIFGYERIEV
jgi:hypothetical protein